MAFTEVQRKALSAKLSDKHVRSRNKNGFALSYIEGWHAIAEANRVFGFDAWDRETVQAQCVWEGRWDGKQACSYTARVRIKVRAGKTIVSREGSGAGNGMGFTPGEAHENALKEAETDAMKRALTTFGNPFGLALYDKEQKGVRHNRPRNDQKGIEWKVVGTTGETLSIHTEPKAFCTAVREQLEQIKDPDDLMDFWRNNQVTVVQLRQHLPDLTTDRGQHYGEVLGSLFTARLQEFAANKATPSEVQDEPVKDNVTEVDEANETHGGNATEHIEDSVLSKGPRRVRDKEHLAFVASRNCMVCGRNPAQAHHLKHAQPRAMSRKPSDEWTVPLCATHHRALHDHGNEPNWWVSQKIDPIKEAGRLWSLSNGQRKAG